MPIRLRGWLERIQASYWFLPSLIALASLALAYLTLAIDRRLPQQTLVGSTFFGGAGQPDGARELLSTVAGSIITVAGVVFSVTVVALSLASQQYGPRILDNFMRDRGNQLSLGSFIATFLYSLVVLRVVQGPTGDGNPGYVPHVSVTVAFGLTVVNLGVFIFFVHHAAESIQANFILARIGRQLNGQILALEERDTRDPQTPGAAESGAGPAEVQGRSSIARDPGADGPDDDGPDDPGPDDGEPDDAEAEAPDDETAPRLPEHFEHEAVTLRARRTGYVQRVSRSSLVALASEHGAVIRLHHAPGSFVLLGGPLADVYPPEAADELRGKIEQHYVLGAGRTPAQDPGFLFDQLLEVAVRALSPSINDPFTALTCVDRMAEALNLLSQRELPPATLADDDGTLRLVLPTTDLAELTEHLFGELRGYAAGDLMVGRHMATVLRSLQATTAHEGLRRAAGKEVGRLLESAEPRLSESDFGTLRVASRRITAWIRLEEHDAD